jgi:hypothetical protein
MKIPAFFILFVILVLNAMAQKEGAQIIADPKIDQLVEKHIFLNQNQSTLDGWRVQIFFDAGANSKKKATDVLSRFDNQYPDSKAYLSFKEPYYRVRVGDFRTRLEAEGFMKTIQGEYPNAFATSDKINPPPPEKDLQN